MRNYLEDPEITRTMASGYPYQYEAETICECCGDAIDGAYWESNDMILCHSCLIALAIAEIKEDDKLAAKLIGAERRCE